jgi:sphingolipid delta-4 desaturase
MDHHKYLGQRGRDNDLPSDFEILFTGRSFWLKALWLLFFLPVSTMTRGFLKPPTRWEWINIGVQTLVIVLIVWFFGGKTLAYFGLSTFFGSGLHPTAAHWIHEHYLYHPKQETYSYGECQ